MSGWMKQQQFMIGTRSREMSCTKNRMSSYGMGEGAGLPKRRVRCDRCNTIIDNLKEACPKCGCLVFTMPGIERKLSNRQIQQLLHVMRSAMS